MAVLLLTDRVEAAEAALERAGLGPRARIEPDVREAVKLLESDAWDLVLIDAALAGGAALDLIEPLSVEGRRVVVVAAQPTLPMTLRVLRSGALDVLPFPPPPERLRELAAEAAGAAAPEPEVAGEAAEWISASPVLLDAFRGAIRLAATDAPVLVWGETGTGKERLARIIHEQSARSDAPLVTVNCGALPEAVLESELFGHERGAGPGVFGRRIGRYARADGGTLFLDEIEQLTPRLQQRVVRALRDGVIEPRGATEEMKVDVRLIASAERDPRALEQEGMLLSDLFYALSSGGIHLPPLRDRGEADIRELTLRFVAEFGARYGGSVRGIADDAWTILLRHPWPGNVRQLRGAIERAVIEARGEGVIHATHLPPDIRRSAERLPSELSLKLEDLERRHIARVLELTNGHQGQAAELLGIHRNTLRRKLQAYGLESD